MPSTPTSSSKWLSFSTEPCFQCERVDFCKTTCWTGQRLEQFVEWNIPQITYHLISVREIESSIIPICSHGGGGHWIDKGVGQMDPWIEQKFLITDCLAPYSYHQRAIPQNQVPGQAIGKILFLIQKKHESLFVLITGNLTKCIENNNLTWKKRPEDFIKFFFSE